MKIGEIIKLIEKDGWVMLPRTGTSHRQYKHSSKPGRVTIAGHRLSDDLSPKMENSIRKQAGLK